MKLPDRFRGLSSKIYFAFLFAALVPVGIAGLVGILYSLDVLKRETLGHLDQEVGNRAAALGRFADQLASELLYLANSSPLRDLADAPTPESRGRIAEDFAAFASVYPHIYQIRYIDERGREVVRVDRRDGRPVVLPESELQDKSDRYYVRDAIALAAGGLYVSPLDLNVERGRVELPERPVVRFATPVMDHAGVKRGILIVNLHGEFILDQVQQLAGGRGGVAYLFDRSGHYLERSGDTTSTPFRMQPVDSLRQQLPEAPVEAILAGGRGTGSAGKLILAYAPVQTTVSASTTTAAPLAWSIALAYPESRLFAAMINVSLLYGVLAVSLLLTAGAGFVLSRHLLRPLRSLQEETQEIARGNFTRRVEVRGRDEIADLGRSFNLMAGKVEEMVRALARRKDELEDQVAARTAQLALERANLDTVIQNTADGIIALDAQGRIQIANQAAATLLDQPRSKLTELAVSSAWPELAQALQAADALSPLNLRRQERMIQVTATTAGDAAPERKTILVLRDVTEASRMQDERRELDRQLFQAEKMNTLGELAVGLAHEIGNPLAGMKTVVQALLDDDAITERTRRYLGRMEREIDRLTNFLRGFQGVSGPPEARPVACRLDEVLDDVLLWTRKEAKGRGIRIGYAQCASAIPKLWADPNQLKQLLLNLVINAVHAVDRGGQVNVGMCLPASIEDLRGRNPRIRFCVEDDGCGIPPDVLPRIFDPFFTTRESGTGLGLAIVKKIATQHGADIVVRSVPGKGTRVELVWPIAPLEPGERLEDFIAAAPGRCDRAEHAFDA